MASYFVMAKMDDGDAPFDENIVNENFPENYMLVPGHVWLVVADAEGSYEVANLLALWRRNGRGVWHGCACQGYWGFAHKRLWQLLQRDGSSEDADRIGRRTASGKPDE